MKKTYKAMATVTDGKREWDVCIYSSYESEDEAMDGILRFVRIGFNVVKTWIE